MDFMGDAQGFYSLVGNRKKAVSRGGYCRGAQTLDGFFSFVAMKGMEEGNADRYENTTALISSCGINQEGGRN